jgi:hypothetical protein
MAINWPWMRKTIESKTPEGVALSDHQMAILDNIIPGFAKAKDPNLLEALIPGFNDPASLSQRIQARSEDMAMTNYQSIAAYGTIYTNISGYRKDVVKEVNKIRTFYLVDVILNQVVEDALAPDVSTGDILKVWSENPTIDAEIKKMNERYDFDDLVCDIAPDMLAYGDYVLKTDIPIKDKNDKPGLQDIHDTVDQEKVVAITKRGKVEKYLVENKDGKLEISEPANYIKFTLGNHKIRVDLRKEYSNTADKDDILSKVPKHIRIGKSLLYPVIAKIKELELLEQLVPATKLSKLSSGTLIGVQLPPGVEIDKAMQAARKIEGMINKKIGIDIQKQELTLESIISAAGRLKVVPLLGDKGTLQKLDYKSDEPDDLLRSVEDVRKVICTSIGVPYEIIFGGTEANKGEILKKYARYLRRLKSIQKAIAEGIREMISIHLANKGVTFKEADVKVEFRNKLIEIDNLDRLEFVDTTINLLANQIKFVNDLRADESVLKDSINVDEFRKVIHEQLTTIGLGSIISMPDDKKNLQLKVQNPPANPSQGAQQAKPALPAPSTQTKNNVVTP